MNKIRGILFDAGGTLVLHHPVRLSALFGFEIDPDEAFRAHYETISSYSQGLLNGETLTWEWWLEGYSRRLGHPSPAEAGPWIENGFGLWTWEIEGAVEAVKSLKRSGIRVAVVSNSDGSAEESLNRAGFEGVFEFVVDSFNLGIAKPNPAIFEVACDQLELPLDQVGYVGDSLFHDVLGARKAGLGVAWLVDPLGLYLDVTPRIGSVVDLLSSPELANSASAT